MLAGLVAGALLTPVINKAVFRIKASGQQWERRRTIQKFEGQVLTQNFKVERVAGGFTCPWDISWAPDGRMFVADRTGDIYLVDPVARTKRLYHRLTDVLNNEHTLHSGLFDVEFHPDFATNRLVYVYYSFQDLSLLANPSPGLSIESGDWGLRNKVVRFRDEGGQLVFDRVIFVSDHGERTRSSGGRLHFGPDGMLYISSPFATTWSAPQNLGSTLGKMLRVTMDGEIPADNPFAGKPGVRGEIWTYGHKDIYGFDWRPEDGALVSIEHGPTAEHVDVRGFDEINVVVKGSNYGFPLVWGDWPLKDTVAPVRFWPFPHPPGDLMFYRGNAFPGWKGQCFITNMANSSLHRLRIENGRVTQDEIVLQWIPDPWSPFDMGLGSRPRTTVGRVRAVKEGPDGAIYVSTDWRMNTKGRDSIYRLVPAGAEVAKAP